MFGLLIISILILLVILLNGKKRRSGNDHSAFNRRHRKTHEVKEFDPSCEILKTDRMDGRTFEIWCAKLLQCIGFTNVEVTQCSNDKGVDIVAFYNGEKYAIQCKRYAKKLGNTPVQEVFAGKNYYGCTHAAVMTNNYFTDGAVQLARVNNVILWDRNSLLGFLENKREQIYEQNKERNRETYRRERKERMKHYADVEGVEKVCTDSAESTEYEEPCLYNGFGERIWR